MGIFTIRADVRKNRAYLAMIGLFEESQVAEVGARLVQECAKLAPGFDLVNDISACRPMTPHGVDIFTGTQKQLKAAGVRRVVRIVSDAIVANLQMSLHSDEVGYIAAVAKSVEEADRLLDAAPE